MRVVGLKTMRGAVAACLLLLPLLLAEGGGAQLPALEEREKHVPARLLPVVRAEHAFAKTSVAKGMKDAFLAFAADDGVLFRGAPVNAKELWSKADPAPTALLTWFPTYADVSRAGDLAYTTGPWEIRPNRSDKNASGTGHFVTVWRAQADGSWKYVADIGISHAAPPPTLQGVQFPRDISISRGRTVGVNLESARKSLSDAERAFAHDSTAMSASLALLSHAAADVRLYRPGGFPSVGREAVAAALKGKTESATWQTTKTDVAASGDLGYAYGTYELKAKPADEKPSERGSYLRIWKQQHDAWRVVLNITNPAPPLAQAQ